MQVQRDKFGGGVSCACGTRDEVPVCTLLHYLNIEIIQVIMSR